MKRFFNILFFSLFTVGIAVLAGYFYWRHINDSLANINIHIARNSEKGFINRKTIEKTVEHFVINDTVKIKDIDYNEIEKVINNNPWVKRSDVFTDIEGNLVVNVKEVEPVLRVFPQKGEGFYIDMEGDIIPLSSNYVPRLMVANGYIKTNVIEGHENVYDTVYKNNELKELLLLTKNILEYPFVSALTGEIYLNSIGEYELIPAFGCDVIKIGNTSNIDNKLEKLIAFYEKAYKYEGWDKYKLLNLKYKNQIICTKN